MSSGGTLDAGGTLRLFLALLLPDDVEDTLREWGSREVVRGRRLESYHVTLAFLGSRPRSEVEPIVGVLRDAARGTGPFTLEPVRYRETRSVGMLVLEDPTGEAAALAERVHDGLERLGVYRREARAWLPHVTVVRFRERPRLAPPLPDVGPFAPSEAAAFVSRLHPSGARYEILEKCPLDSS